MRNLSMEKMATKKAEDSKVVGATLEKSLLSNEKVMSVDSDASAFSLWNSHFMCKK